MWDIKLKEVVCACALRTEGRRVQSAWRCPWCSRRNSLRDARMKFKTRMQSWHSKTINCSVQDRARDFFFAFGNASVLYSWCFLICDKSLWDLSVVCDFPSLKTLKNKFYKSNIIFKIWKFYLAFLNRTLGRCKNLDRVLPYLKLRYVVQAL